MQKPDSPPKMKDTEEFDSWNITEDIYTISSQDVGQSSSSCSAAEKPRSQTGMCCYQEWSVLLRYSALEWLLLCAYSIACHHMHAQQTHIACMARERSELGAKESVAQAQIAKLQQQLQEFHFSHVAERKRSEQLESKVCELELALCNKDLQLAEFQRITEKEAMRPPGSGEVNETAKETSFGRAEWFRWFWETWQKTEKVNEVSWCCWIVRDKWLNLRSLLVIKCTISDISNYSRWKRDLRDAPWALCVCVCQTLYLREINTFLQTDSPTRSSAFPYNNSKTMKTGGRSTLTSLLPTKTLVKRFFFPTLCCGVFVFVAAQPDPPLPPPRSFSPPNNNNDATQHKTTQHNTRARHDTFSASGSICVAGVVLSVLP